MKLSVIDVAYMHEFGAPQGEKTESSQPGL